MLIYVIHCTINDKKYIGQTINSLDERWKEHVQASKDGETLLYRAMRKHGIDAFKISLVEECQDRIQLNEREIHWISKLKTLGEFGYNLTAGGQGCLSFQHDEKTKQHLSNVNKGRQFSEEHRRNLSEAQRRRMTRSPHSLEARKKMSEAAQAHRHTDETKRKMSESRRGKKRKPFTKEHRQRISEARRNHESQKRSTS